MVQISLGPGLACTRPDKAMRRTEYHLLKVLAAMIVAAAEAYAEDRQGSVRRIVVSIPDRKLILIDNGRIVKTYAVAVGAPETPSPTGTFQVVTRVPDPAWYQPGRVVPPGPGNPLGPRWIGLSQRGYGIHGTNSPRSIGGAKSHGCIRMRNSDVEELFELVDIGDVVELRAEKTEELAAVLGDPLPGVTER
jgi:lipoprotein-anchoring transpeptidase ErfK/SrfK